jgi:hypothetical protein
LTAESPHHQEQNKPFFEQLDFDSRDLFKPSTFIELTTMQTIGWTTAALLLAMAPACGSSKAAAFDPAPAPITISNNAVKVSFSSTTGELVSLVNLRSEGAPDDYLFTPQQPPPGPPQPVQAPFCVQQTAGSGSWYMKTGGDPNMKTNWKGVLALALCLYKNVCVHAELANQVRT